MKKKLIAMALAASMVASLSACGSKPAEAPAETEAKTETEAKAETEAKEETEAKAEESAESSGDVKSVEGLTVAFVPKLTGNAFFESANNGAQKYAEKWGFTVDYQGSSNASVADQVQVINNAIASGVDGICISSVDATGLDSALTDAISSGVTVGTWDSDVSDTARSLMVSQGTPDILGQMLVDMGADSLTKSLRRIQLNTAGTILRQL